MSSAPVPVGRFLLFKSLKKGGMARVFLGVDRDRPEELVAVKTLLPKLTRQRMYTEMFTAEGKVGERLAHPHIVGTLEHGNAGGNAYIALDYIFGFDLSTVLRKLRRSGSTIPLTLAVGLARDVADGLSYAHELTDEYARPLNIVNRDVSPGNIMIGFDGVAKLIDFGIAQTTIDVKSQIGSIKGKISYMAPEQVRGLPVDARADLFSLGTVLYEMLTGIQIFHDEGDFATMERVRQAKAPPASEHNPAIDGALDTIIARTMAREAGDRYQLAREIRDDLDGWLQANEHEVRYQDIADFMRGLFGAQIDEMRADIAAARDAALGAEPAEELEIAEEFSLPPRLISEDALEDRSRPVNLPVEPAGKSWVFAALAIAVGVAIGLWAALR